MRQTLFRIWLEHPWAGWTMGDDHLPLLGACWLWLIGGSLYFLYHVIRHHKQVYRDWSNWITWGVGFLVLSLNSRLGLLPESMPVFGYGAMVLLGFVSAMIFTTRRAKAIGMNPETIVDLAFWLLVSGVAGGRIAYLLQYGKELFFSSDMTLLEKLYAAVNLSEGGLVLIGALVGGALGMFLFCARRKLNGLDLADLIMPAVFIGIGFGRLGCLLNGCCFGDRCDLPWAITFPEGSVTYSILVERGFVAEGAPATIPLHPTQIYSSIDGFILAIVTGVYYWYRRYPGDVLALGCILYPITRFLMEFLRADEMGQLGTGLTISQLYSLGILVFGILLLATGPLRARPGSFQRVST